MKLLRFSYRNKPRKMSHTLGYDERGHGLGARGRMERMKMVVTSLYRHERIEGNWDTMDEARTYAELLIQEAQKHGDTHGPTMELADHYLLEKDLIHKLFKVLVPRYQYYEQSFTSLYRLPTEYPGKPIAKGILELKGNPYPPVLPRDNRNKNSIVNILLSSASKDFKDDRWKRERQSRLKKYREISETQQPNPDEGTPV